MKIDDYKLCISLRTHNHFQKPFAQIYDYNITYACGLTNSNFIFGTITIYNEKAATFVIEKTKNLLDCRVEPHSTFLGLQYLSNNRYSRIYKIEFPHKIKSIERVVHNMRQFSDPTPWRLRIKLRNVVDKFSHQQALDAAARMVTL